MSASEQARRLPDFFIVGAPRCGTTFMHTYLRLHPQVFMPATKEPHFFAPDLGVPRRIESLDEYAALFAPAGSASRVGEASVWYLYSEFAARSIRDAVPHASAIVMLRDPIELMRSLHAHNARYGIEDIADFEQALAAEEERVAGRSAVPRRSFAHQLTYRRCAQLGAAVARLLDTFPRGSVHFILLEDLAIDAKHEYAGVLGFLGVDQIAHADLAAVNQVRRARGSLVHDLFFAKRRGMRGLARRMLSPDARVRLRTSRAWRAFTRMGTVELERPAPSSLLVRSLREELAPDVALLSRLTGRDLAARWWGPDGQAPAGIKGEVPRR